MDTRTTFLGKLLGLFFVLTSMAMAATKDATTQTVTALVHDAPVVYVLGLLLVAAGVAMILSLDLRLGGAFPLVIRLVSWLTLIKGLAFLFSPPSQALFIALWGPLYERFFYLDAAIMFVLGAYLMFASVRYGATRP